MYTNSLHLFSFVDKDEDVMQRNEMLFCKGWMADKKNHFLSFGQMQSTPCTKGTKNLAVSNNLSPCYFRIAAYLNNIFLFGRARDQPPPLVRPKQSLAFMPFLAW